MDVHSPPLPPPAASCGAYDDNHDTKKRDGRACLLGSAVPRVAHLAAAYTANTAAPHANHSTWPGDTRDTPHRHRCPTDKARKWYCPNQSADAILRSPLSALHSDHFQVDLYVQKANLVYNGGLCGDFQMPPFASAQRHDGPRISSPFCSPSL